MQGSGRRRQAGRLAALAAGWLLLLAPAAAQAGLLTLASLQLSVQGQPVTFYGDTSVLAGSTAQSAYVYPGDMFAGTSTYHFATSLGTQRVRVGNNGALFATPSGVQITAPITGSVALGPTASPLFTIPLAVGTNATVTRTAFGGLLKISVIGSGWHVGAVRTTGTFTRSGAVLPTHTFASTGSFNINPSSTTAPSPCCFATGSVKLVTLTHIKISGAYQADYVSPSSMYLYYAGELATNTTPPPPPPFDMMEPSALLLLTAAGAGLAGFGRRRKGS